MTPVPCYVGVRSRAKTIQETTSKPHNGAETVLETLDQVENREQTSRERRGNRATVQKPYRRHPGGRAFFSTGQAAQELGTSIPKVRALCETGMIEAEVTPGNQWRVPVAEVERLKRDGLPPIPRPMPVEEAADFDEEGHVEARIANASASSAVADAVEEVEVGPRSGRRPREAERTYTKLDILI